MFENVDGRRTTDAGVTGILIAHLGAFGSGELKRKREAHVTSNDGKFSVISKAQTVARKANQHKRPRNERTRKG